MTEKKPDTRYEDHLWSISSSGTLYYATMPGQNRSRQTHLDVPTRLGRVMEVKYTSRHYVQDSSERVGAFKLKVAPPQAPASASQSPVYAVNKWYVLVENKFDTFAHVDRWRTPVAIRENYEVWTEYPNDYRVSNGRWLKNYFKTAEQKDDSGFGQRKQRKRSLVRTSEGTNSARRRLVGDPSSSSSSSSAEVDVFGQQPGPSSAANSALDTMMASQDSLQPPPDHPGIMICVCWWFI